MENKGYFIDEAENPGGNDWDMKNLFFILFNKYLIKLYDFYFFLRIIVNTVRWKYG